MKEAEARMLYCRACLAALNVEDAWEIPGDSAFVVLQTLNQKKVVTFEMWAARLGLKIETVADENASRAQTFVAVAGGESKPKPPDWKAEVPACEQP